MNRLKHQASWIAAACATLIATSAGAQPDDEEDLALAYGGRPIVSIATGSRLPVSRAPAVASVITAQDIAAMGATDIDEVLETVPGLHVARGTQAFQPLYVIRGLHLGFNPQVLMLVDGVPLTKVFAGNRGQIWGGLPLENVERIEIIRGPGSALYGAEAFAGVVNVITKTTEDFVGTEVGARAGSDRTRDGWVLHGGSWGDVDVAAYLRLGRTDGSRRTVEADAQTGWDAVFGTGASRAPGRLHNERDFVDAALDLSRDGWRLHLGYVERSDVGVGTGIASALDPQGRGLGQTMSADLSHAGLRLAEHWSLDLHAGLMHYKEITDAVLFPAGAFNGAFTDGMIGNPYKWERHGRIALDATFDGWAGHRVRLGLGADHDEIYKIRETKNFNPDFSPIGTGSFGDVTDVSDTVPFLRPTKRHKWHAYVQDEWSLAADWTLTAGLRHDHYSDFGNTLNPRLALVWEAAYDVTAKLLYGTAFRAPSMTELYAINNPVVHGNPELKPEKIRTLEAALSWQPTTAWRVAGNVYRYSASDIIRLVDFAYANTGRQDGYGLELEAAWQAAASLRLSGNTSWQHSEDEATGQDAGNAPRFDAYVRADWQMLPAWSLHAQLNWIGERRRVAGDTREPLKGWRTVDLTLRSSANDDRRWSVAVSVRNLFDADAREPSTYDRTAGQPFVSLPYDFPLAGRTFYVQASYVY